MTKEELKEAQERMLAEATSYGNPSRWGKLQLLVTTSCPSCAFVRGLIAGSILAAIVLGSAS